MCSFRSMWRPSPNSSPLKVLLFIDFNVFNWSLQLFSILDNLGRRGRINRLNRVGWQSKMTNKTIVCMYSCVSVSIFACAGRVLSCHFTVWPYVTSIHWKFISTMYLSCIRNHVGSRSGTVLLGRGFTPTSSTQYDHPLRFAGLGWASVAFRSESSCLSAWQVANSPIHSLFQNAVNDLGGKD